LTVYPRDQHNSNGRTVTMKRTALLALSATALAIAGCAHHPKEPLPPGPGEAPPPMQQGPGPDAGRIVPGSAEDFRRSVTSDTVHFSTDQYDIDATARGILDSQVGWLQRYPQVHVTIEGHCDERGTREYNLALGDRRANATKNYLAARGIDAGRITTISYGKERPIALGSDEASWAQNRRAVTIVVQ
jgi:peptidoglycan-associated lipoprotein